jgi:hypothetical protein
MISCPSQNLTPPEVLLKSVRLVDTSKVRLRSADKGDLLSDFLISPEARFDTPTSTAFTKTNGVCATGHRYVVIRSRVVSP